MGKSKKSAKFEAEGFIKGLRSLLDTLPSESQKQEINEALNALISFFSDLQNTFRAMPSIEDAGQVSHSLLKLEELFASVEKIPGIARTFGSDARATKQSPSRRPAKEITIDVKEILTSLVNLSSEEIKTHLTEKDYSVMALRALLSELGSKSTSGAKKESLVDKLATDIVNRRMHGRLAGESNSESLVS